MPQSSPGIPDSVKIQKHLTSVHVDEWLNNNVLTAKWWALLGMILALSLIWCICLEKKKLRETCLYAALATISILALVEYGEELVLWDYPTDIIPIFPPLTSVNLIILPLSYSLAFQRFQTGKSFIAAVLAISAGICFVVEPLLSLGDFYHTINWKYYFSFPVYTALALFCRFVTRKLIAIASRNNRADEL